jgi:hypothetical protein
MKSYRCFIVSTAIIETQESSSPRSVKGKWNGPRDEGMPEEVAFRLLIL